MGKNGGHFWWSSRSSAIAVTMSGSSRHRDGVCRDCLPVQAQSFETLYLTHYSPDKSQIKYRWVVVTIVSHIESARMSSNNPTLQIRQLVHWFLYSHSTTTMRSMHAYCWYIEVNLDQKGIIIYSGFIPQVVRELLTEWSQLDRDLHLELTEANMFNLLPAFQGLSP